MIERGNPKRKLDRWKDILYFKYIVTKYLHISPVLSLKKGRKIHVN